MGIRAFWPSAFALGIALVTACGDNIEPPPDPDQGVDVELETVAPSQVAAGDTINITCTLAENGITTMVPADIKVVDDTKVFHINGTIVAGNDISVTCTVYDDYGNVVDGQTPSLSLAPDDNANTVAGLSATMIHSGHYIATCQLPGSQ